jgi:hypothetical protein
MGDSSMITERRVIEMMTKVPPKYPIYGSRLDYEVTSIFKGTIKCKSRQTE